MSKKSRKAQRRRRQVQPAGAATKAVDHLPGSIAGGLAEQPQVQQQQQPQPDKDK
jgi:hypothetical protein